MATTSKILTYLPLVRTWKYLKIFFSEAKTDKEKKKSFEAVMALISQSFLLAASTTSMLNVVSVVWNAFEGFGMVWAILACILSMAIVFIVIEGGIAVTVPYYFRIARFGMWKSLRWWALNTIMIALVVTQAWVSMSLTYHGTEYSAAALYSIDGKSAKEIADTWVKQHEEEGKVNSRYNSTIAQIDSEYDADKKAIKAECDKAMAAHRKKYSGEQLENKLAGDKLKRDQALAALSYPQDKKDDAKTERDSELSRIHQMFESQRKAISDSAEPGKVSAYRSREILMDYGRKIGIGGTIGFCSFQFLMFLAFLTEEYKPKYDQDEEKRKRDRKNRKKG